MRVKEHVIQAMRALHADQDDHRPLNGDHPTVLPVLLGAMPHGPVGGQTHKNQERLGREQQGRKKVRHMQPTTRYTNQQLFQR